ncbi:MAG: clostripain-related cysteine peptidase [Chloroflexota bacterium]
MQDIDAALETIQQRTGIDAFEIVGMDACLMGHAEVFTALAPHARYAVASQETEPAVGWAYTAFLDQLVKNPDMSGADLSKAIVDTYIVEDQRVTDSTARSEFVRGTTSANQLATQLERSTTISAIDLQAMPEVIDRLNELALVLQGADQRKVAQARNYAQSFTSVWGSDVQPSYIDLAHFTALLTQETGDSQIRLATENLFSALNQALVAEKSGPQKPGANGVSIYFPNSQLYGSPVSGPQSYIPVARRFADVSLWDDFLNFHYTGRQFQDTAGTLAVPDRAIEAPGEGNITLGPVTLSDRVAAPGQPVTMSADVNGDNIGYVYLFAGLYDRDSNSIYMADTDYIDSGDTREVSGVYYPDWGEGEFTLEFDWDPIVFAINDGTNLVQALFQPQSYGVDPAEAIYTVDGVYTYTDGEQRDAQLQFSNGELQAVYGFTGSSETAAPREIIPSVGDRFTVYEKWMDLDTSGRVVNTAEEPGQTITFGEEPIVWEVLDAAIGDYTIGFIVEDLDGNRMESYADVNVQ